MTMSVQGRVVVRVRQCSEDMAAQIRLVRMAANIEYSSPRWIFEEIVEGLMMEIQTIFGYLHHRMQITQCQ